MARKSFHFVVPYKQVLKNLQSTTTKASSVTNFSIAQKSHLHSHSHGGDPIVGAINQGSEKAREVLGSKEVEEVMMGKDSAWDAKKERIELVTETTISEADMNVVDTAEYRSSEDLTGQLGDGCDKIHL